VAKFERTRKLADFFGRFFRRNSPTKDKIQSWVDRSLMRHGYFNELERMGLVFNPEEKSRLSRIFLRLNRSRGMAFLLNPTSLPAREIDLVPLDLLEKILQNGLPAEKKRAEELFHASPARHFDLEQSMRILYNAAFLSLGAYEGVNSYKKTRKQQEKIADQQKEEYFHHLEELEKNLGEIDNLLSDQPESKMNRP
jgi:hypothetical protein